MQKALHFFPSYMLKMCKLQHLQHAFCITFYRNSDSVTRDFNLIFHVDFPKAVKYFSFFLAQVEIVLFGNPYF